MPARGRQDRKRSSGDKAGVRTPFSRSSSPTQGLIVLCISLFGVSSAVRAIAMSGIEVAGLVLGALPVLLKSVDAYRDSFRRFGTTFNKRKHVEKLARAILLQQRTLEELIKSVVLASGCEDVLTLDDDPIRYLNNPDVQEQVEEYLGPKSTKFLVAELEANSEAVRKLARCISGLVPGSRVNNIANYNTGSNSNTAPGPQRRLHHYHQSQPREAKFDG